MVNKFESIIKQLFYFPKYDLMYLYKEEEDYAKYVIFFQFNFLDYY